MLGSSQTWSFQTCLVAICTRRPSVWSAHPRDRTTTHERGFWERFSEGFLWFQRVPRTPSESMTPECFFWACALLLHSFEPFCDLLRFFALRVLWRSFALICVFLHPTVCGTATVFRNVRHTGTNTPKSFDQGQTSAERKAP